MSFSTAKFFIATLYKFTQAGKDEVIHRFDTAIRNQSSICRYLSLENVFELECALDNGDEIASIFTDILNAFIEDELRSSEEQGRAPTVRLIPESCEDENDLSTFLYDYTNDGELSQSRPAVTESRGCTSYWKPRGPIPPLAIMDESQLQQLALQVGCSLSAAVDESSVMIEADNPKTIELAMARLAIVERSQCLQPIETHFFETEQGADDFRLRCFRLSFAMLARTLIPEVEALRDSLHTKLTCRWLSYSRVEGKYVLRPQQLTQVVISPEIEELSRMWIRIPLLEIGDDQLQPAPIIEPADPRIAQAAIMSMSMEPDKVHQVDEWISHIEADPSQPLISLFPSPSKTTLVKKHSANMDLEGLTVSTSSSATSPGLAAIPPSSVASSRPSPSPTPTPIAASVPSSSVKISARAPVPSTRASVKSTNIIRTYEDTPFGEEAWAKNVVVAGGRSGKIIDLPPTDTVPSRPTVPPGYPTISQQACRFPKTLPFAISESVKHTTGSQRPGACHTLSSRDWVNRPAVVAKPNPINVRAGNAKSGPDLSKAKSTASNKIGPGRSKMIAPPRSTYSSVAQSTDTSKSAYNKDNYSLPPSDTLADDWNEVKSRRYHKTMRQQARCKSQRVKKSRAALSGAMSSPAVSATPAKSFDPNINEVQKPTPYLFSPILEGMSDTTPLIEDGPLNQELLQDLIGLDLCTFSAPAVDISAIESALCETLAPAQAFRGDVRIELQVGRILLGNVPKEIRNSPMSKQEWESAMSIHHPVTDFTNMVTSSATDTAYILSLRDSNGRSLFDFEPCDTCVTYVFDCVHADKGPIRVTVDPMDSAAYSVDPSSKLIGAVYLHHPKRNWDCRLAVSGISAIARDAAVLEPIKNLVDSLYVRVPEGQVTAYFQEATKQLHVESLFVKKEQRFKCTNYPSVALKMVEVQALVLGRRAGDSTVKGWARDSSAEMVNERRLWYEVSLEPLQPLAAFKENRKLGLGEEASWTAEDLLKNHKDLVRGMKEMAQYVVTRIDDVGFFNKGPRGGPGDAVYDETVCGTWAKEEIGFW